MMNMTELEKQKTWYFDRILQQVIAEANQETKSTMSQKDV